MVCFVILFAKMELVEILNLNVEQLKEKLTSINLECTGNKAELQARLIDFFRTNNEGNMQDDDNDEHFRDAHGNADRSAFTFRDMEESISQFSGDDDLNVLNWVREFEEISDTVGWNVLQKFIFAKRLLRGSARLFANSLTGIKTWKSLKDELIKEFKKKFNSAEIHKQLSGRKKKKDETFLEYIYKMTALANNGNVEEEALISYIIEGIGDKGTETYILYAAKTITELKEAFKLYEKIKNKKNEYKPFTQPSGSGLGNDIKRCHICGDKRHSTDSCPNKSKGFKCFRCNEYGHKSTIGKKSEINILTSGKNCIEIKINRIITTQALLDSGADISIIRWDIFRTLNKGYL